MLRGAFLALSMAGALAAAEEGRVLLEDRPGQLRHVELLGEAAPWPGCALLFEAGAPDPHAASRLSVWCPDEPSEAPRHLLGDLPPQILSSRWVQGTSAGWLEVGHPGGVDVYCADGESAPVLRRCGELRDSRLAPGELEPGPDLDGDGTGELVQGVFDGIAAWRRSGPGGLERIFWAPLPVQASASSTSVGVRAASVLGLVKGGGDMVAWTAPKPRPGARLRMHRVPLGAEAPRAFCSAWVKTEEPVLAVASLIVPGNPPHLAALVQPSERLALLNEQRLMVASLECDRTRRGQAPAWVDETPLDNYLGGHLLLRDVTGDARPDLIALGVQGRLRPRVRVEVYAADAGGGWESHGDRWLKERVADPPTYLVPWDRDLDGDGVNDLAFHDQEFLFVVPGVRGRGGEENLDWEARLIGPQPATGTRWLPAARPGDPVRALMPVRRRVEDEEAMEGPRERDALLIVTLRPAE
jgi:hypothetical protein